MKSYPTKVLLSISTGHLLCDFGDMHECIEFLAGEPVFTHQLAHRPFYEQLRKAVIVQHPDLDVNADHVTTGNWEKFRDECVAKVGLYRDIIPMGAMMDSKEESFTEPLKGKKVIII